MFCGDFFAVNNVKFWMSSGVTGSFEWIKVTGSAYYQTPTSGATADSDIAIIQPASANVAIPWFKYPGSASYPGPSFTGYIYGTGATTGSTMPIRLQLQTAASISAGPVSSKTFALSYDLQ